MMNHLWQSTIFALAIALLTLALRKNRASIRHWLWFAASIKFLIPLTLLTSLGRQAPPSASQLVQPIATAAGQLTAPFPEPIEFTAAARPESFDWMPWLLAAWACGFLAIALMRFRGWLRIRALLRASTPASLHLPVEARFTSGLLGPGIVGIWKPVLLLPAGIEQHLTPKQFNTAIAHELTHVRRRDNLLSAIHMLVEAIFWFHPLVWLIGTRLVEERELACDEAVIAQGGNPRDYAEAILNVCKHYVEAPVACVSGVTGADIKKRLEAILTPRNILGMDWTRKLLLTATALVAAMVPFLAGIATAQSYTFEVVSIKPLGQGGPAPFSGDLILPGGNFRDPGTNLRYLIALAYGIEDVGNKVIMVPKWAETAAFAITAKAGPEYPTEISAKQNQENVKAMLRSMLSDRFQLKMHREERDTKVLVLQIKSPAKLRAVPVPVPPETQGRLGMRLGNRNGFIRGKKVTITQLVELLALDLKERIVDRTGLKGFYDFNEEWEAPRRAGEPVSSNMLGPEGLAQLASVLDQNLGLVLTPQTIPAEVWVVDHVEEPSEN